MEFKYSNIEKEMEVYGYDSYIKSFCRMCHGGCGVIVYLKDGKAVKIQGDPECPINHGTLCSKAIGSIQTAYNPDRLTYPVKRVGPKGSNQWERISWDEALDTIAERMLRYKEEYGEESVVLGYGTGRDYESAVYRFANSFGTPNVLTAGHFCYGPRLATTIISCGTNAVVDYENKPRCIMVWGNNLVFSNPDEYKGESFSVALDEGAKLIVVDPRRTRIASRANVWLQIRPTTDTALALGMCNVIIQEGLYDKDFCENHFHEWDKFVKRAGEWPLDRVERTTWVPREKVIEAARLFATTKPAAIQWGVGLEMQANLTNNDRVMIALMGITGNLDVLGGQMLYSPPEVRNISSFGLHGLISKEQFARRLGGDRFRLGSRFAIINPKAVWDAILEEQPYPVKMLFLIGTNPVLTRANAKEVYRALEKVDFLAVSDFFITPTALPADIVLPSATWLETDNIGDYWKRNGYILPRRKAIQVGECRSVHIMLNDLANRAGLGQYWWPDMEQGFDHILEPLGLTWKQFKEMKHIRGEVKPRKYKKRGFSTPTRKLEIYSTILEKMGYDPLPQHIEAPGSPYSAPELYKEYPYICVSGRRIPVFFCSEGRQVPALRALHKDPVIEIHPETAEKEGIKEGEWVCIETSRGKVRQRARLFAGMDPRIVFAQHGWWFPEAEDQEKGWQESNINMLTDNSFENCDPAMGGTAIRTFLCKIYPEVSEEGSTNE